MFNREAAEAAVWLIVKIAIIAEQEGAEGNLCRNSFFTSSDELWEPPPPLFSILIERNGLDIALRYLSPRKVIFSGSENSKKSPFSEKEAATRRRQTVTSLILASRSSSARNSLTGMCIDAPLPLLPLFPEPLLQLVPVSSHDTGVTKKKENIMGEKKEEDGR